MPAAFGRMLGPLPGGAPLPGPMPMFPEAAEMGGYGPMSFATGGQLGVPRVPRLAKTSKTTGQPGQPGVGATTGGQAGSSSALLDMLLGGGGNQLS